MNHFRLTGLHHVSAVSARIGRSHDFYTRVLGMRPIIRTVNQDDPRMYHLFFGDGAASPGSDMTVFDMPNAAAEQRGNNAITRTTFRVNGSGALEYWASRLTELGYPHRGVSERDGRGVLDFDDAVGTALSLVDDGGRGASHAWGETDVPAAFQIRGLGYVVITVPSLDPTHAFLTEALGLRFDREYATPDASPFSTTVYAMGGGGVHAEVHVLVRDDLPRARHGSGGVHHLALRVPDGESMEAWVDRIGEHGYRNSGIVDRHYFTSLYVREPNGVLFELATDGPGFEVDGPISGTRVSLPPFLEPKRAEIEAGLRPIRADD